jgi:uncharacterized phosphatase
VIGKLQGHEDIPLNAEGREQARRCGSALKRGYGGYEWKAVITSPLMRAKETAQIIAEQLNIRLIVEDKNLMERDYGKASGTLPDERKVMFPDGKYEGAEEWGALRDRVYGAVTRNAGLYNGDIIIVSHGGSINAVLAAITDNEIGSGKTRLKNACINMFEYDDGKLKLIYYNKTSEDI